MAQNEDGMELDISDELIAERRAGDPGDTPEDMHPLMRLIVGNIDILNNIPTFATNRDCHALVQHIEKVWTEGQRGHFGM